MKTVAYLRVSTPQQDVRSQRLAILEYARTHDIRIDDFIEATASGQASEKRRRRRLDELTSVLQRGDRLVVSELWRLGRSLGQIVTILDALAKAGVAFVALKENIRIEGRRDIQTKVMTTLFALFAEGRARPDLRAHPRGPRPGEVLGPEARSPEGLAGRLTARRQGGRDPALPRAGRLQDRHRQADDELFAYLSHDAGVWAIQAGAAAPVVRLETVRVSRRFGTSSAVSGPAVEPDIHPTIGAGVRLGGRFGVMAEVDRARAFTLTRGGLFVSW